MQHMLNLFKQAVYLAQYPTLMRSLAAVVCLQARFRGSMTRRNVAFARNLVKDRHCTVEYGIVTPLNGITIVERSVPVHHNADDFVAAVKECLRIDGVHAAIINRYVTRDTISVDGGIPLEIACVALHGGSICRIVPPGRVGITALMRCSPQWTVQLQDGQRLQVHSQPASTMEETICLVLKQLKDAGLLLSPSAARPRLVTRDGLYTEIHSCAALNKGVLSLKGKYTFIDRTCGPMKHPDEGVSISPAVFDERLHPYTLCTMKDKRVGDQWLMPIAKRRRHG